MLNIPDPKAPPALGSEDVSMPLPGLNELAEFQPWPRDGGFWPGCWWFHDGALELTVPTPRPRSQDDEAGGSTTPRLSPTPNDRGFGSLEFR